MPPKTSAASGHATPPAQEPVDVLIVTALAEEYRAVHEVDTGAVPESTWEPQAAPPGLVFASRRFLGASGEPLLVGVVQAPGMGEGAAAGTAGLMVATYRPRCLAMCGVCGGRKGHVELGDVILAKSLWNYESGKREVLPDGSERFLGRALHYQLHSSWHQLANDFQADPMSPWLSLRPRTLQAQEDWVLEQLLRGQAPWQAPQRQERCADYTRVMERLHECGWVHLHEEKPGLTDEGRRHIHQRLNLSPNGLPEPPPFRVRAGPLATGNKVVKDSKIFEQLSTTDYKVIGLEMEAAGIAAFAHHHQIDFMLVMKGVTDFADGEKNDHFKPFAARASAECLLAFLRSHLPAAAPRPSRASAVPPLSPVVLAEYKQACAREPRIRNLDLRGLVGIAPGRHETELDLLEFAVAPLLHDQAEEDGSREAMLRGQLQERDLAPARKQWLQQELEQLEHRRRSSYAEQRGRSSAPHSFAELLGRYRRLAVIGEPGAGKSILTRLAFLACMEGKPGDEARWLLSGAHPFLRHDAHTALQELRQLLPVRLTLGRIGQLLAKKPKLSFEKCIRHQLREHPQGRGLLEQLRMLLAQGQLFLICDGLDEVAEAQRQRLVNSLTEFLDRYPEVRLLLTSRPQGYRPKGLRLQEARLATLSSSQQHELVSRLHRLVEAHGQEDASSVARAHSRTQALMRIIQEPEWHPLTNNPLLLTLTALTRPDEQGAPRHRVIVFENFALTLLGTWRDLVSTSAKAEKLLEVWAAVAFELVRQEKRHGDAKPRLLRTLEKVLEKRPARGFSPERVLHLALEAGLIHKREENLTFWHSLFVEFLAAYSLTRREAGAAKRLLRTASLPPLVLQLAAARLSHVQLAHEEVDALVEGLLERDGAGQDRLLHPHLRAASACLKEGVTMRPELALRIWSAWAEILERTPPSPLWRDFSELAQQVTPSRIPQELVERFARIDARGMLDVQEALARWVVLAAEPLPSAARDVCLRDLRRLSPGRLPFFSALGLALAGDWDKDVLETLARLVYRSRSDADRVGQRVRQGGPQVLELLRGRVRARLPSDEPSPPGAQAPPAASAAADKETQGLRLSAACLLALGGAWDEDVAWVLMRTLSGMLLSDRVEDAKVVVRHCAEQPPVRQCLLEWLGDDSALGRCAQDIIREAAPLIDGLPEEALERTVQVSGAPREALESMMISIGTEQRSLLDVLRRWLEHEAEERQFCAARILRKLVRHDEALHAALRRGMSRSPDASAAAWAHLAFGLSETLTATAVKTLQACARSADPAIRGAVYQGDWQHQARLSNEQLDGWLACALDTTLPAKARLEVASFLAQAPFHRERVVPLLQALLNTEDASVRERAAYELIIRAPDDAVAATVAVEAAARALNTEPLVFLQDTAPFAAELVKAILRGLPREPFSPPNPYDWNSPWGVWAALLKQFAAQDLSCVKELVQALALPGIAGEAAKEALERLIKDHPEVRLALIERLVHAAPQASPDELFRLVALGLLHEETAPSAAQASRLLEPSDETQARLDWLASHLCNHVSEEAARLWRAALEGPSQKLALEAAGSLAWHFPERAGAWIQPALRRLLEAAEPLVRVHSARLALSCGQLPEAALEVLLACVTLQEQDSAFRATEHWTVRRVEDRALAGPLAENWLLEEIRSRSQRVDVEAMYALLRHRPELGTAQLTRWLQDPDYKRFKYAVRLLMEQGHPREALRAAIEARLRTAPVNELPRLTAFVDRQGFSSVELVEVLLACHPPGSPAFREVLECLVRWEEKHPELWSVLRRQEPAMRDALQGLLGVGPPRNRDALSFAVDFALRHADDLEGWHMERTIRLWCDGSEQKETHPSEQIRGWLREILLQQPAPSQLDSLLCLNSLAQIAGLSPEYRLPLLSRALAIDITALEPDKRSYLAALREQVNAAIWILKLHGQDDRIPRLLETAVHAFAEDSAAPTLQIANELLNLQPADSALRQAVLRTLTHADAAYVIDQLLDVLDRAGFSRDESLDVVSACLGVEPETASPPLAPFQNDHWPQRAPAIFEALEKRGFPPPRRAALLERFLSLYEGKLPAETGWALAARAELSPAAATKWMLGLVEQTDASDAESNARQWMARAASQRTRTERDELSLLSWKSSSLSRRMRIMSRLAQVDEPALVERALADLARVPIEDFLAVYHRAREGAALPDATWDRMVNWLSVSPGDSRSTRFAKEWLMLGLWRAREPAAVEPVASPF